ncbi:MAG TPA: TraB/GumN family protein [Xanthomonadaceae bacterium]
MTQTQTDQNDQTDATHAIDPDAPLEGQPHAIVERDGVRYTLLGTAHVSKTSVDVVRAAIATGLYDTIAVELDPQRAQALTDPDALARLDLVKVLREGKTAVFAANLGLAAYQRRLAEQLDIEPGAELKAAVVDARERGLALQLIDRDVGLTFKRAMQRLGFWGRAKVGGGLMTSLFVDEKVSDEQIEGLKQGDMLESSFSEFAADSPALYETVIAERDAYMAARLREIPAQHPDAREVLAVVGAGHLQGMEKHLREDTRDPAALRADLETVKEKSSFAWFTLLLAFFVLGGFAWGFWRGGAEVGGELVLEWVLVTGTLGAIGCLLAGGHPLSILTAFVSSPITPLHPALASGTLSALVEAWVRKPTYADFMALRDDVQSVRGWWRNRVARTLLNFFLTSFGTAIGVWTGGAKMLKTLLG